MSEEIKIEDLNFVGGDNVKITIADLDPKHESQWCPGCGNYSIVMGVKNAIVKLGIDPKDVLIVSGIGCSSKFPHYLKTYGIETIHGRALPVATGAKLANKDLHVIVVGGDGDGYGIGMGHLIHTMRRNINLTYVINNNEIYALTKGQTSPTTPKGKKTASTPNGSIETPINPMALALGGGATFIAKSFSGDIEHMSNTIAKAIAHKGFSIIDVAQICPSFNPEMNFKWYKDRIYNLENLEDYNSSSKNWAMIHALESQDEKIGIGIFYHSDSDRETYIDDLPEDKELSLVRQDISNVDVENILDNYE